MKNVKSMKKWTLLLLTVLSGISAAQAQISFYGEWCYSNGELISKTWVSPKGARSESIDEKTGEKFITIIFLDTRKAYALFPDKKSGILLEPDKMNTNQMVGLDLVSHEQGHQDYLGVDEVDGRACKKYYNYSTHINNMTGENETENVGYFWYYEPMKASNYSGCIAHQLGPYEQQEILRNIRMGPQPDHLFEIPEDYAIMEIPDGGMLEMLTGKPREQNQKDADDAKKSIQEGFEEIQKATDKSKSQEEHIKDLMKLLEGMQNKKK